MDKSQAEAAAKAMLAQARATRRPKLRATHLRPFATGERRVMAMSVVPGLIAGSVGAYLGLGTPGWAVIGSEWGVTGGLVVASLVVWMRRVLTRP